jgi:hypothetical protein
MDAPIATFRGAHASQSRLPEQNFERTPVGRWHGRKMGGVEGFPIRPGTGADDFHKDPVARDDVGEFEQSFPFTFRWRK